METFERSKAMWKQSRNLIIGHETILTFGKYRGLRVKEVIAKDKQYIAWLLANDASHMYGKALIKELFKPRKLVKKLKPETKNLDQSANV